jgi:hypothetical protein
MAQCVKGDLPVPLYHFVLKTKDSHIPDPDGGEWPNDFAAHEEAALVAQDLMRNEEIKRGSWRIEVCDEDLRPCSEVLFAEIDKTISPELRQPHILASRRMAALSDAVLALRKTLGEISETIGQANTVMALVTEKRG